MNRKHGLISIHVHRCRAVVRSRSCAYRLETNTTAGSEPVHVHVTPIGSVWLRFIAVSMEQKTTLQESWNTKAGPQRAQQAPLAR